MRAPNPSSFKNFSKFGKKSGKKKSFFFLAIFLGTIGIASFFLLCNQGTFPVLEQKPPRSSLPLQHPKEAESQESYVDFEKEVEIGEHQSQDMEEEEERTPQTSDSELVKIFKDQERQNLPPFSDSEVWRKNAQKHVVIPKGKHQVVLVVSNVESLSSADWQVLHTIDVPLTFVLSGRHPKAAQMAMKAWKRGREIVVQPPSRNTSLLAEKFPRMVGVLSEILEGRSYLTVSRVKGLVGGLPHTVFGFPLIRDKNRFLKTARSIVWVNPRGEQLCQLVEWISQQKKKVAFTPLSQLYPTEKKPSNPARIINPRKIEEARAYLG